MGNKSKMTTKLTTNKRRMIATTTKAMPRPSSDLKGVDLEDKARIFYRLAVVGDRKYRFRTHRSVFVGKEMVDAMVIAGLVETRPEAVRLGRVLAKKFNFFQNIENNIMNKTIPFEDSSSKFYRFSSGALWVIRDPEEEGEGKDDTTASTTSTSSTEDEGSSIDNNSATKKQTPPLPRQTATRHLIVKESSDSRSSVMDVSVFKKKQQSTKSKALNKKTAMPMMPATAMQAIVEDENEEAQTATLSSSSSNINSTT